MAAFCVSPIQAQILQQLINQPKAAQSIAICANWMSCFFELLPTANLVRKYIKSKHLLDLLLFRKIHPNFYLQIDTLQTIKLS